VADDKEAVEDAEADRGHGEEVHGRNRFPLIRKKCAPALGWLGISRNPLHPAGDGSLGDIEAQHEQFAVNARRTPGWVLRHHTEDQLPNFRRQFFPTDLFSRLRDQTPVQSKTSAMPANDRLRIDEHERLLPSTPERRANTQKILSTAPIRGLGCLRFSTASCCRRARFSRSRLRCDCQQRVSRPNHNPTWRNMKDSHSRYCR